MPKVSIIVPSYNYGRFLPQRLRSIEQQTFRDSEIILLDDASTDESPQILQDFARRHGCRLVPNEQNSGSPFKQWNKGARLASGEYLWFAEADDYCDPRFVEVMVSCLDQHPECGFAYCNSLRVDANDRPFELALPTMYDVDIEHWRNDFIADGRQECARYLLREDTIPNVSAILFRRGIYERVGGADESLRLSSGWKLSISILAVSNLAFIAEPLNYFRTHPASVRSVTNTWLRIIEAMEVMTYTCEKVSVPRAALQDLHARLVILLVHSWLTLRPTATERATVKKLLRDLGFGWSWRAVFGVSKQVMGSMALRLPGKRQARYGYIAATTP